MPYKIELEQELKQAESDLEIVLTMQEKLEKFCKDIEDLQMGLNNRLVNDNISIKDYLCDWIADHIIYSKDKLDEIAGHAESALERY